MQIAWIQTAWVETKTVKEQKLQVATKLNSNKEITKLQNGNCELH